MLNENRKIYRDAAEALVAQMTVEEAASQLLHHAPAIEHLGVPEYNWWNEALHGVARAGIATVFPQAIAMAAAFDPEWSPNINIFRDPRWGRGHETYGEDPTLTKEMGKAFIRGL